MANHAGMRKASDKVVRMPQVRSSSPSLTVQAPKKESDINNIAMKYLSGLRPANPNGRQAIFGDVTAKDFMEMQNFIIDAGHAFMSLPSRVRGRFSNDPYQMLRFLEDPANKDEAVRLGIATLAPEEQQQVDLAQEAEKADREAFAAWKARKAEDKAEANPVPTKGGKPA